MNRDNIALFLEKIFPFTFMVVLIEFVYFLVFKFMKLNFEGFVIGSKIVLFLFIVYLGLSFFNFKSIENYKKINKENLSRISELENEIISNRNELENYFLLWLHQIKTPITSSKLIVENNINNEEFLKIKRNLISIEDYTNMAMNYLKITNSNADMYIAPLKLDDLIKEKIKKYSSLFISNKISIEYEKIEKEVVTDAKWFGILFEQILSNAIKYTNNGKIKISFNEIENYLEILDTGIGISKEDLPKIFDKGYSGFNGKLNEKSTGLGLFLVKEIANKISVSITVDSKVGVGSVFRIYFLENREFLD